LIPPLGDLRYCYGFACGGLGKFGPPEADGVKKCAQRYLAGRKMNADRWLIEECKIGWVKDKIGCDLRTSKL